jgi:hypothetical protein
MLNFLTRFVVWCAHEVRVTHFAPCMLLREQLSKIDSQHELQYEPMMPPGSTAGDRFSANRPPTSSSTRVTVMQNPAALAALLLPVDQQSP